MLSHCRITLLYRPRPSSLPPSIGTNGLIPPPKGYLRGVREVLSKYGIMMVCDEVMCGLGRTGEWFAVDHYDIVPDILVMAKGITSAYLPLGEPSMH